MKSLNAWQLASWVNALLVAALLGASAAQADQTKDLSDDDEMAVLMTVMKPRVSIVSPAGGYTTEPQTSFVLTVSAATRMVGPPSTITQIQLFDGATLLATISPPTTTYAVSNLSSGTHAFTAKVFDSLGGTATSSALAVLVNARPTASVIAPQPGAVLENPQSVELVAAANDADGTITKVEFYRGTTLIGISTTGVGGAFSYSWTSPVGGLHAIKAIAFDNSGASTESAAINITVIMPANELPTVTLDSPAGGAQYQAPASIPMLASPRDTDGTIVNVKFYAGTQLLSTATASPYAFTWSGVAAGSYVITAKAEDNSGAVVTSNSATITVGSAPLGILSVSASSLSFAMRAVGTVSGAQTITYTNIGNAALTINNVTPSGFDYGDSTTTCLGATLQPGNACTVSALFTPYAVGDRQGQVSVSHTGGNGAVVTYLFGSGEWGLKYGGGDIEDKVLGGRHRPSIDIDLKSTPIPIPVTATHLPCAELNEIGISRRPDCRGSSSYELPEIENPLGDVIEPVDPCAGKSGGSNGGGDNPPSVQSSPDESSKRELDASSLISDIGTNSLHESKDFVADPIHAASGAKSHPQTDYIGDMLSVHRTYQALAPQSSRIVRVFNGAGWYASWDKSVALQSNGTQVRTARGDGTSWVFTKQPNGTWTTPVDPGFFLQRNYDANGNGTGWKLIRNTTTEHYNLDGRLQSAQLATGQTYTLSYGATAPNRLTTVTDPAGLSLAYSYDAQGRLKEITDPASNKIKYTYDAQHRLTQVEYPDGRTRQYRYEHPTFKFALTAIINESGQTHVTFTYDGQGRALGNVFAGNTGQVNVAYNPDGSSTASDPTGATATVNRTFQVIQGDVRTTNMQYQCTGCGAGGANTVSESFTYDANGFPASHTNKAGIVTTSVYDSRGLPSSVTIAAGTSLARTTTTVWHPVFRLPAQINEPTRTTVYQYDAQGRNLSEAITADGQTRTTTYTYNAQGLLATVDGPRTDVNDITSYTYDAQGRPATVTNPKGQVTTYNSYDAHGNVTSVTAPNGVVTTSTYDARSRLLTQAVAGQTTTHSYNLNGLKATITNPFGSVTTFLYDAANRLIGKDLSNGDKERHTLDNVGRIIKTERFDSANVKVTTTSTVYDGLGRVKQRVDANGKITSYTYDVNGNVTAATDPNNLTTTTAYDVLNRPILVTDPLGKTVNFGYNVQDKIATVTDPNSNTTSYTYSGFGENTQTVSPDTGTTTQTFNSAGSVLTKTDARGKTAIYTYDVLGRMTQVSYLDGTTTHTYDVAANGVGQLANVTDPSGSTTFTYDAFGRVANKAVNIGGVAKTMSYARDSVGRVAAITYPSGKVLGLLYEGGKVVDMTWQGNPLLSDIQYFPFGAPESWLFNDNREYTRFTDQNGRTEKYLTPSGYRKLTIDDAGRITQIGDHLGSSATPSATQSFGYDNAGRLTSFNGFTSAGVQTQSFTYDNNGNRLSSVLNGTSSAYAYQSGNNRLSSVTGGISRNNSYDAVGNLTSNGSHTFSYDDRGRLKQAIAGGLTTSYSINYQNLRVKKSNSQETKLFVYDQEGRMLGEYDQAGNAVQELVWLGDTPVAVIGSLPVPCGTVGATQQGGTCSLANAVGYIWTDHLNSPREITVPTPTAQQSNAHSSIWKWDSLPFADTAPNENPASLGAMTFNHRFPGQYRDSESGLYQNWHRDYDPSLGRYVQSDPLGQVAGVATFSYTGSNPISKVDPSGLIDFSDCEMRWLVDNYGVVGTGIIGAFSVIPEAIDAITGLGAPAVLAISAAMLKLLTPETLLELSAAICPAARNFWENPILANRAEMSSLLLRGLGLGLNAGAVIATPLVFFSGVAIYQARFECKGK